MTTTIFDFKTLALLAESEERLFLKPCLAEAPSLSSPFFTCPPTVDDMTSILSHGESLLFFDDTPGTHHCWAMDCPSSGQYGDESGSHRLKPLVYLSCVRPFKDSFLTPNGLDKDASLYVAGDLLMAYANTGDPVMDERRVSFLVHPERDPDFRNFLSNGRVGRRKAPDDPNAEREWISLSECFDIAIRNLHTLSHTCNPDDAVEALDTLTAITQDYAPQVGCPQTWKMMKAIIRKCLEHVRMSPRHVECGAF